MEYLEHRRFSASGTLDTPKHVSIPCCAKGWEAAAMVAVFTMDLGWVALQPVVGLPATLAAIFLQTSVVFASLHGDRFDLMQNVTVLLWVLSNAVWMFSEFLWDEARPEGVLALVPGLQSLDKAAFPIWLAVGGVLIWTAAIVPAIFYANHFTVQQLQRGSGHTCFTTCSDGNTALGMPLRIYRELFVLPWLISDACWMFCNRQSALGLSPGLFGPVGVAFGVAAIAISTDATLRYVSMLQIRDAALCAAELLWVSGNVAWMAADLHGAETVAARACFGAMFAAGLSVALWLAFTEDDSTPLVNCVFIPCTNSEKAFLLKDYSKGEITKLNAARECSA